MTSLFYISSAIAIIATLMVIISTNAVHALLYLAVSLLATSMIFLSLGAPFAAALEVIVYAGAIVVLILFVIMILNQGTQTIQQEQAWLKPATWAGPAALTLILAAELLYNLIGGQISQASRVAMISPKQIGVTLFGPYMIAVELSSLLLLAGLIGAYHLGRPKTIREAANE